MKEINEKYFSKQLTYNTVEDVLEEGEKILERTKPLKKAYKLAAVAKTLPIVIIWLCLDTVILTLVGMGMSKGEIPLGLLGFIVPFFILHLAPVWMWIYKVVKSSLEVKNIEYVFTNRRIIIRSGVIVDFKFLYYDKIESVSAKVGILDRLCKVGDIYITAAGTTAVLFDQTDPYRLSTKLNAIASDLRKDIYYPNAMRPAETEGEVDPSEQNSQAADENPSEQPDALAFGDAPTEELPSSKPLD